MGPCARPAGRLADPPRPGSRRPVGLAGTEFGAAPGPVLRTSLAIRPARRPRYRAAGGQPADPPKRTDPRRTRLAAARRGRRAPPGTGDQTLPRPAPAKRCRTRPLDRPGQPRPPGYQARSSQPAPAAHVGQRRSPPGAGRTRPGQCPGGTLARRLPVLSLAETVPAASRRQPAALDRPLAVPA